MIPLESITIDFYIPNCSHFTSVRPTPLLTTDNSFTICHMVVNVSSDLMTWSDIMIPNPTPKPLIYGNTGLFITMVTWMI